MRPFDRWIRSRTGWALANLFYDKSFELPEASEVAAWKILIAVQNYRTNALLREKVLELVPHYDPKGSEVTQRFQDWAEWILPALAEEKKRQDNALLKHLRSLGEVDSFRVTPVATPAHRGLEYAQKLSRKVSFQPA